jgi:hypothetical protein
MAQINNKHRLRERLAEEFNAILDSGEVLMKDGEPVLIDGKPIMKRPSPAMYNVIRQYLKDNGIDRDPLELKSQTLIEADAKTLPFDEDATPRGLLEDGSDG